MHDSLIRSSFRSFLIAFFSIMGIILGAVLTIALLSQAGSNEDAIPNDYTAEIQPNAEGIRKKLDPSSPVILEIDINGVIGSHELNQRQLETQLIESRENSLKDNRVKAILLKINSPGGSATDADGMYQALTAYKARYNVPIFAYGDGLVASGGMYVACASDKIYASDASIIGSIGVITSSFVNVSDLMQKIGVNSLTVYAGKGKDELNPLRPWKADEDKNIKEIIDSFYQNFVAIVVKNRKNVDKNALIQEYGAQVFPADVAKKIGFIDEANASRNSTLKQLLAHLQIEDDFYQVVSLKSTNWLNQLITTKSPIFSGTIKHEILLDGQLPKELLNKPLYLYRP